MIFHVFFPTTVVLLLATYTQGTFPNITYEDLKDMEVICREYHTCKIKRLQDNERYKCLCGDICHRHDTCCFDSEVRNEQSIERKPFKCISQSGKYDSHYFMVDSCDHNWSEDNTTEELCKANPEELDNLFLRLPVTNTKTRITYRNYFCAVCNNDSDDEQILFWDVSLGSDSREIYESFLPGVRFYTNRNKWVVPKKNKRKLTVFININPKKEWNFVYPCLPDLISDCAEDWNDTDIKEKCHGYMAPLYNYDRSKIYRNPHCAICNYKNYKEHKCPYYFSFERDYNGIHERNFSLFSKTNKCDGSMFFDTIAKKCVTVTKDE